MSNQDKASGLARQALADLATRLDAGHSDALRNYLAFMARFHRYSWLNTLLIALQRPDATFVAGFTRWKEMRRYVRQGERGIAILVPIKYRKRELDEDIVTGFRTGYVFDLAQTDGQDVPEIGSVTGDPGHHLESLRTLTRERGIKIGYRDSLDGARGVSIGGQILLVRMEPAEEFAVLAHELAHELLHRGERRSQTDVRTRELEAEAVAFVVSTAVGLQNETASADYIHLYRGDNAALALSLQYVQTVAAEILDYLL